MGDNLEGKFRAADSARRKDATDEFRLTEIKTKLIRTAERKLQAHLSTITGAKILNSRVAKLDISESESTGLPTISGKIVADVSFIDGKNVKIASVPVAILNGHPEVISSDIKDALEAAVTPAAPASESTPNVVTAALSDFKVVDDGTRYLKIYHTAAYGDLEPIGAVSKEEYVVTANKSALLSEMFKDEAAAWTSDVNFTGTFVEPAIVTKIAEENLQYVVRASNDCATCHHPAHDNKECGMMAPSGKCTCKGLPIGLEGHSSDRSAYKFTMTDTTRLALEAADKNYNDMKTRLEQRAHSAFLDHCKAHQVGTVKVKNTTAQWDATSGVGEIKIEAEILDGKDTKLVPFTVGINGVKMSLPDFSNLESMLKEAKVVNREIQGENIYKNVTLEAGVEKTAASAPQVNYNQEFLRLPKDFLPASLVVGDVIAVDGLRWKLSSKSEGQLSSQKDGALYWLFERVYGGDEKPVYRQEGY